MTRPISCTSAWAAPPTELAEDLGLDQEQVPGGLAAAASRREVSLDLLRCFWDLDQDRIAARVGLSQLHLSRLQRRALAGMRAQLVGKPDPARSGRDPGQREPWP